MFIRGHISKFLIKWSALDGAGAGAEEIVGTVFPVDVKQHELLQTEGLHVRMIDRIEAEVEQILVENGLTLQQGTDIQFQLVEHLLIDITVRIDQVAE